MAAFMAVGLFVFSIPTLAYDQLQRRTDWRHGRTGRVGVRDATQFLGVGDETISLAGTVYSELAEGEASLDQLRDMAGGGEVWPLLCGSGRVYGSYVITGIDERHTSFWPSGAARSIDFTIDLLRVDEPVGSTA